MKTLRGCEPKKVLVEAAKTIDSSKRHQNKGIIGWSVLTEGLSPNDTRSL